MKKNLRTLFLALVIITLMAGGSSALAACGSAPTVTPNHLTIASGAAGGVWNPLGVELQKMLSQYLPGSTVSVQATSGGIENLKLLSSGQADLAFTYDYHVVRINQGLLTAAAQGKKPIRILMGLYEQPLQVVTRADSGITSLAGLKGKRVSTGTPGSGVEEQAGYVLQALGIDWDKDIQRQKLGAPESAAALKAGQVDAFFWSGAMPTSTLTELGNATEIKMVLLPIDEQTSAGIMQKFPGVFHRTIIPTQAYPGVTQPIETLAISAVLSVRDDMSNDQARQILAAIFNHVQDLVPVWSGAEGLTPDHSLSVPGQESLIYLHPAAAAYFLADVQNTDQPDVIRDALIKSEVETAASMLQGIADKQAKGDLTEAQAKALGADLLRGLSYGADGYFWADTEAGVNVVLYGRPDVEGRNRLQDQDEYGTYYIKALIAAGQAGGGYVDYWFSKKGETIPLPKRGYALLFKPFGWVIGTGYYR